MPDGHSSPEQNKNNFNNINKSTENIESSQSTEEPSLTDKLNKRLLCSYLERLNNSEKSEANNQHITKSD